MQKFAEAERVRATQNNYSAITDRQNSDEAGRTDDIVAEKLGIGSNPQHRTKTIRLNRITSDKYRQKR